MPTTLTLSYTRFVRQVTSGPGSLPQFAALMDENFIKLKAAAWVPSSALPNDVAMPANTPLTFTINDKYDAFKMSSTTSASGVETAYAGMAAYRLKIPADAISGHKYIKGLTVTLGADKFAYSGIKVAIHATNDTTPATSWEILRTGAIGSTVDTTKKFATYDANPEVSGVLDAPEASVSSATNKAQSFVFDLSAINTDYAYLWIYISMYNYTDYRANRPYWVEGAGIVNGATAVVEFESSVTADASTAWNGWVTAEGSLVTDIVTDTWSDACWKLSVDPTKNYSSRLVATGFPMVSNGGFTVTRIDGSAGFSVGFDSNQVCDGAYLMRYLPSMAGKTFTRLKFSGASLLPMLGKTFAMNMNIWTGILPFPTAIDLTTERWLDCDLRPDVTGLYQANLFHGTSVSVVRRCKFANDPSYVYFAAVPMTLSGRFTLKESNYTSDSEFTVSIAGGGTIMVLVTLNPVDYWGAIGTATKATFTPGTYIYLK